MAIDQVKLLARLLEGTRSLSSVAELETYLQSILSAASELTESETAIIMEYDAAAEEFFFRSMQGFHDSFKEARVPLNGSVAARAYLQIKPLVIDDVINDTRHFGKIDEWAGFETRSLLMVPLVLHGTAIGVFEVRNKIEGAHYSGEDILVLETFASLAATAMQNNKLENNFQSSQNEARDLNQLKNEFIAISSHELRTPLGLILGHSTFLRELLGAEYHEQVDIIIRNASKLKEIIESLSNIDNFQTGGASLRSDRASVARIIEDVSAAFRELAIQKGVSLNVELDLGQDLLVFADTSKISIVLSSLVKNAITFSNEGGHIIIRGSLDPQFVKVVVQDDGIGIPARDLPNVFERFYQVESHLTRRHGGMGLGLSVAKAMIEMHGGRIWVESMEGMGSIFTFLLPLNPKRIEPDPSQPIIK